MLSGLVHSGIAAVDGWDWPVIGALVSRILNVSWVLCLINTELLAMHGGFGPQSQRVEQGCQDLRHMLQTLPTEAASS